MARAEGRIKTKVRALMLEAGWDVTLFWEQHGDYRIRKYQWDLACWGCHAKPIRDFPRAPMGFTRDMACWYTMSECAKRGLSVDFMDRDGWEINPNVETKTTTANVPDQAISYRPKQRRIRQAERDS